MFLLSALEYKLPKPPTPATVPSTQSCSIQYEPNRDTFGRM